ncbi:hypothetical protein AC579_7192 [Pseudocercospora musae]|uniref:Major facilitator superfamily (MFS) profile domain-containing protein n=1 Tax=Pseudocercospora musae TaxID=113226 RepID=A0A139I4H1_9PEZI|nr:hypothetical protein AC579_7192 [Pseudocercospora musae]
MPYLGMQGNALLAAITCTSGMGFILFGYDDGVMGGVLTAPSFESQFKMGSKMQGTVTSIFLVGAFLGCMASALLNGKWGRKTVSHAGSLVLSLGAVLQSSSYSVAQLLVGRIVAGVGLGLIVSNIIMWQTELSPGHLRGLLVASALSFLILGQLIAYWLEYGISGVPSSFSWRFPMAFQAALGIATSVMLLFVPESPRYLYQKELHQEAKEVLTLLNTHRGGVNEEALQITITEITEAIAIESSQATWSDLLKDDHVRSRRRVALACFLNACQAWSGSTPISYYTTYIFENSVGLSYHTSLLLSGILQVWFLVASFGTWYTIEKLGRRISFMVTAVGMTCCMAVLAAMIAIDTKTSGIVGSAMIFLYQAFYTWGFMGGIWVYGPEIMPLTHRAKGEGLATACLWLSAFVVTEIVPEAITNIGWRVYIIFASFNLAFVPFVYFFLPETAGLTLESIDLCFMDRSTTPVKKANDMRKQLRSGVAAVLEHEVEAGEKKEIVHVECSAKD